VRTRLALLRHLLPHAFELTSPLQHLAATVPERRHVTEVCGGRVQSRLPPAQCADKFGLQLSRSLADSIGTQSTLRVWRLPPHGSDAIPRRVAELTVPQPRGAVQNSSFTSKCAYHADTQRLFASSCDTSLYCLQSPAERVPVDSGGGAVLYQASDCITALDVDTRSGTAVLVGEGIWLRLLDVRQRRVAASVKMSSGTFNRVHSAQFAPDSHVLALVSTSWDAPELLDLRMIGATSSAPLASIGHNIHAQANAMTDVWRDSHKPEPCAAQYDPWASMAARNADDEDGSIPIASAQQVAPISERPVAVRFTAPPRSRPAWCPVAKTFRTPFAGHDSGADGLSPRGLMAAFTPDGRHVLTSSIDGQHRLWRADTGVGVRTWTSRWWENVSAMPIHDMGTPMYTRSVVFSTPQSAGRGAGGPWLFCHAPPNLSVRGMTALFDLAAPPLHDGPLAGLESPPPDIIWHDHAADAAVTCVTAWGGFSLASGDLAGNIFIHRAGDGDAPLDNTCA